MFKALTIPLLSGTLAVSVIINLLLIKRLKRQTTTQSLKSIDWLLTLPKEDDVTEDEVNAVLAPILQEVQDEKNDADLRRRITHLKKQQLDQKNNEMVVDLKNRLKKLKKR